MNSYNVSSVEVGCFYCSDLFRSGRERAVIFGRREANGGANFRNVSGAIHRCIVD